MRDRQDGFSLIELMVSLTVTLLVMTGATTMLLENSRINKSQQMTALVQANARNCMSMIVQKQSPVDYVAGALLASASALIGNSRWVSPWSGWK